MALMIMLAEPKIQLFVKDAFIYGYNAEKTGENALLNAIAVRDALKEPVLAGEDMEGHFTAIVSHRVVMIQHLTNAEYAEFKSMKRRQIETPRILNTKEN